MRLLLTPVLILYVVVGMFACSDAGEEARNDPRASQGAIEGVGTGPSQVGP